MAEAPQGSFRVLLRPVGKRDHAVELPRFRRPRVLILVVAALALIAVPAGLYLLTRAGSPPSIAFSEFLRQVDAGKVTEVTFRDRAIEIGLRDGSRAHTVPPPEFLAANASFITDLYKRQIRVDVMPTPGAWMSTQVPKLERDQKVSVLLVAPTVIADGSLDGEPLQASAVLLPADTA